MKILYIQVPLVLLRGHTYYAWAQPPGNIFIQMHKLVMCFFSFFIRFPLYCRVSIYTDTRNAFHFTTAHALGRYFARRPIDVQQYYEVWCSWRAV